MDELNRQSRHRWFQLSLRSLFLLMLIVCAYQAGLFVLLGWLYARGAARGWPLGFVFTGAFVAAETAFPLLFPFTFGATMHDVFPIVQAAEIGGGRFSLARALDEAGRRIERDEGERRLLAEARELGDIDSVLQDESDAAGIVENGSVYRGPVAFIGGAVGEAYRIGQIGERVWLAGGEDLFERGLEALATLAGRGEGLHDVAPADLLERACNRYGNDS